VKSKFKSVLPIVVLLILGSILFIFTVNTSIKADSMNPQVYSIKEAPFGVPYSEWVAKWWIWAYGLPGDFHTPDFKCDSNQAGPVWFLPDPLSGPQTRNCVVAQGKAILVPLITGSTNNIEKANYTDQDLMNHAGDCNSMNSLRTAKVDGTTIKGLDQDAPYRTNSSKIFTIDINSSNQYGTAEGVARSFADGWFLFLKPLPVGEHELNVGGSITPTAFDEAKTPGCAGGGNYNWHIKIE
jgi:hypothetical protein